MAVTLRLADGRELEGAIVDPVSGALVWAPGGEAEVRALLAERHERIERDFRAFGYVRPVFPGRPRGERGNARTLADGADRTERL